MVTLFETLQDIGLRWVTLELIKWPSSEVARVSVPVLDRRPNELADGPKWTLYNQTVVARTVTSAPLTNELQNSLFFLFVHSARNFRSKYRRISAEKTTVHLFRQGPN